MPLEVNLPRFFNQYLKKYSMINITTSLKFQFPNTIGAI